jgi:hypothetical protein
MREPQNVKNGRVYLGVRIPVKLKRKLAQRAKADRRSEAGTVERILEKALAAEEVV